MASLQETALVGSSRTPEPSLQVGDSFRNAELNEPWKW